MKQAAEPEDEMVEVGNELLKRPAEEEPLLELLGRAELLLSKVEQSPQPAMLRALDPVMKGLVSNDLLRHQNTDVKVAVASCISEITRITAPEAPYDDELMKVIFELIVEAFGGLKESPQLSQMSYRRSLSILETVAKVRSCVVMLDLECDGLILEMFHHFFQARRVSHPESAYSLMETIMTVVLEESEDFSSELIFCLLDSVKKDSKDASRELGESVIGKCGAKLKQYLLKEIHANGASLSDYSRIVASVCQKSSDAHDNAELNAPALEDDSKLSEKTVSEELQQESAKLDVERGGLEDVGAGGEKSSEPVVSNGVVPIAKDESLAEPASPSVHSGKAPRDDSKGTGVSTGKSDKMESVGSRADKGSRHNAKKSKGRKESSSVRSAEISDHSPMDIEKGKEAPDSKDIRNSQSEIAIVKKSETTTAMDDEKEAEPKPSEHSNDKAGSISDANRPKRGRPRGPKTPTKKGKIELPASPSVSKKRSAGVEEEMHSTKGSNKNLKVVGAHGSDGKPLKSPANKESGAEETEIALVDAHSKKGEEQTGDIQVRPVKGKEVDRIENEPSKEPSVRKGRRRKSGMTSEKQDAEKESPFVKEAISSPETAAKVKADKDQDASDEALVKKARRKRALDVEDSDGMDERLVGLRIKVWWPDDKTYYPGIIESYDPATKKHKVLYSDGDVEILLLKDEKWMSVKAGKAGKSGTAEAEASSHTPAKKKVKTSSDSTSKKAKADSSSKRGSSAGKGVKKRGGNPLRLAESEDVDAGTDDTANKQEKYGGSSMKVTHGNTGKKEKSTSKSKTGTTDSAEVGSSKKDRAPKAGNETKDETSSKSGKKSKDANPETDTKLKDVASPSGKSEKNVVEKGSGGPKVGQRNKGASTLKSGSKTASNGTSAKEKSATLQGTEDPSPKASEGSRKRGRPPKS